MSFDGVLFIAYLHAVAFSSEHEVPDRRYYRERLPACGFHHLSKLEFAKLQEACL